MRRAAVPDHGWPPAQKDVQRRSRRKARALERNADLNRISETGQDESCPVCPLSVVSCQLSAGGRFLLGGRSTWRWRLPGDLEKGVSGWTACRCGVMKSWC